MALAIANIPDLKGKEAEVFVKEAKKNLTKKGSIDMSKAFEDMKEIITKSKSLGYI